MKLPRYLRLLPSVVIVGGALLVVNTSGLVHAAYAEASEQVASLTADPQPAHEDFAGGEDDQIASASEVDVINALGKRRKELDAREGQLFIQANMIAAAEKRVDAKISQLKTLQAQIAALLVQRDDAQKAQVASLVKTYSTMKPKDAARIFNNLPDDVLVPVAHDMKSDVLALVLANMNADNAKSLTVKLANKLTLPQTTDALAPVSAPVTAPVAAPGPQTSAAPPVQVASAAPVDDAPLAAPVKRKARAKPVVTASSNPLENQPKLAPKVAPVSAPATAPAAAPAAAAPAATPAAAPAPPPKL
ncbi:MAG: MgtE intracellular region [Alphaproteobacteria bacterium]|nr:MgtE intracellular region [Alphaproteobacteria bacterium]